MNSSPQPNECPIAIIGLAGRFPGSPTVRQFWRNLCGGVESITFASDEELAAAGVPETLRQDPHYVRAGGALAGADLFDAPFFGYSAREAEIMDPQQRIFLECAWDALEDSAHDPFAYAGAIGVFASAGMNTYLLQLLAASTPLETVGAYQLMLGNDKDFLATRVAYKLNLRGPALGIQTACSSSLVAVHAAVQSLRRGECQMALAGGVSIAFPQNAGYAYVPGMILSPDGHCRAFDRAAAGTVPGAGAGVVVLRPLTDAVRDRDHIYAVIRGSAINNDGSAKAGYTAPSVTGQAQVIRRALAEAGFSADSISFIETHGTGTPVGDPIEISALSAAFETSRTGFCALGALKTNIGHLDAAAGVAGLIKAALALEHRELPPTLHFEHPNPLLRMQDSPFYVNTARRAFPTGAPIRAGVSSFGIGGTNSHVCLEEAPARSAPETTGDEFVRQNGPQLIVLSARTPAALAGRAADLLAYLDGDDGPALLRDIAYTLRAGRRHFAQRRAFACSDIEHLQRSLRASEVPDGRPTLPTPSSAADPPVVFLFPGQGAQFVNMGLALYQTEPTFRESIDHCCALLAPQLGLDLRTLLFPSPDQAERASASLAETRFTQPALFVVEYALAALWMHFGVRPAAMLGHSIGEYVAAALAGVFSLDDALALVAARGALVQSLPTGAMLAVSVASEDLQPLLGPALSLAAQNAPRLTVAAGPFAAIAELEQTLGARHIECRRLRTSHAFHSAALDPVIERYVDRVGRVALHPPQIPYLSNLTGDWIHPYEATDPHYWGSHLRHTVRFADNAHELLRSGKYVCLEVGPGETLLSLVRQQAAGSKGVFVSSLGHPRSGRDGREHWLAALGRLWAAGANPRFEALDVQQQAQRVPLPGYPFERRRYWIENHVQPAKPIERLQPAVPESESSLLKRADLDSWFYVPSWKSTLVPRRLKPGSIPPSHILFFGDESGPLGSALATLPAHCRLSIVTCGDEFVAGIPGRYRIDPANRAHYVRLLEHLEANGVWPDKVVHAWALGGFALPHGHSPFDLGYFSVLALAQAIGSISSSQPIELNVLFNGAYSVAGERVSAPDSAMLGSVSGILSLEYPNVKVRAVDLDLSSPPSSYAEAALNEIFLQPPPQAVAYRAGRRWLGEYEPVRIETAVLDRLRIEPRGTYLITGGSGGIGGFFAEYLARVAEARIVLVSRRSFPDSSEWDSLLARRDTSNPLKRAIQTIRNVFELGGEALTLQADVSDPAEMRRVMAIAKERFGPVRGIVHAAGVPDRGMLQQMSREDTAAVLAPKVAGSQWIRECLQDPALGPSVLNRPDVDRLALKFVLLCSSIDAVVPAFGTSTYAAANGYLDAFAHAFDDPKGTRVISVNWDTWQEVGMAVETVVPKKYAHIRDENLRHGITLVEAGQVLERILACPVPQIVVSTRDLAQLLGRFRLAVEGSFYSAEVPARRIGTDDSSLLGAPPVNGNGTGAQVEVGVIQIWQELLGTEQIALEDNFFELGGHSLLGTQVLARLRSRFGVDLPLRTVFEAQTPLAVAAAVRAKLGPALFDEAPTPAKSQEAKRQEIEAEREEIEI